MKQQSFGRLVPPLLKQEWPINKVKQEPSEHNFLHRGVKPELPVAVDESFDDFAREPKTELTIEEHGVQLPEPCARYNLKDMMMIQSPKIEVERSAAGHRRVSSTSTLGNAFGERSASSGELKVPTINHICRNVEEMYNKSRNLLLQSQDRHVIGETCINRHSQHLSTDTEKKAFKCDTCGKSCTSSTGLKLHVRIHTAKKPYACQMCDKSFLVISQLRKHIRSHKVEKPYLYHICDGSCVI